jgi:hypothetical protein
MNQPDARAHAAQLLGKNRKRLARAIARQVSQLVPRYRDVDEAAHQRNGELILEMMEQTLTGGSDDRLLSVLEDLMRLRTAGGFQTSDFIVASHCFTPVIRRFFIEKSPDLRLANAAFEEVEALALGIIGRLVSAAFELGANAELDDTAPNRPARTLTDEAPWLVEPITIESVS